MNQIIIPFNYHVPFHLRNINAGVVALTIAVACLQKVHDGASRYKQRIKFKHSLFEGILEIISTMYLQLFGCCGQVK